MTEQRKDGGAEDIAAERQAQADAFHEANSNCFTEFESFDSGWKAGVAYVRAASSAAPDGGKGKAGCSMGVGCDEAGVCYAMAHGQPERCAAPQAECAASDASAQPVAEVIKWKTFTGHTAWDFKVFDQTIEHGTKLYTRPAPSDAQAECDKGAA
jgi:hypothetical protein